MQAKTKLVAFVDQEKPDVMQFLHIKKGWGEVVLFYIGIIIRALTLIGFGYLLGKIS